MAKGGVVPSASHLTETVPTSSPITNRRYALRTPPRPHLVTHSLSDSFPALVLKPDLTLYTIDTS
jgi:hypothetical protein